ncbi:MAG TPA: class I SAM-dependent methyltransferase [Terriglobia bacterium]|nr:class I SAM-dependent methyltransferase [Terriglobia bacterium]
MTWNAADYAQNSQGQFGWAIGNLSRLALEGTESVLDVGCGDGKITVEIARRAPQGRALGIDQSAQMIALARSSHRVRSGCATAADGSLTMPMVNLEIEGQKR